MKKLSEVLDQDAVKIPLFGSSRDEVIKELIDVLSGKEIFNDKDEIFRAVMERERIMTTGVGNGIAIPHCKHSGCNDFSLAMGIAQTDIDFISVDRNPVQIVFLLVGPMNAAGMHIKILSRITRILSKEEVRTKLKSITDPTEAYKFILSEEENFFS